MKRVNFFGLFDYAMTGYISTQIFYLFEQGRTCNADINQIYQAGAEIARLKQALSESQQQLRTFQQQIESLLQTETCQNQEILKLTKQLVRAHHYAHHDELTGLPNRSLLFDRLKQAMAQSDRQQKPMALLFIDLDKFKNVNDQLGHAAGDQLLRLVAERLTACMRYEDTVCRYGGDEFLILLTEIDDNDVVDVLIEKIRSRLSGPYEVDGHSIAITASIGATVYRVGGLSCNELIRQADSAMYRAKMNR